MKFFLIVIIFLLSFAIFADDCGVELAPDTKIENHFRAVTLIPDPLWIDRPGENAKEGWQRRNAALLKLLQWAGHSPELTQMSRNIERGGFTLAIPLYEPGTAPSSQQRLIVEYKKDGTVFKMDRIRTAQANGKSLTLEKTPLNSGADSFTSPHLIWKTEVYRDGEGRIFNEILPDGDKEKIPVYKVEDTSNDLLQSKIAELVAKASAKGEVVRSDPERDLHTIEVPLIISGKVLERFSKWMDRIDYMKEPGALKVLDTNSKLIKPWFTTTFNKRVRGFFKNGFNRLQKLLWMGIFIGGLYLYHNGFQIGIQEINGISSLHWSFHKVSVQTHEVDTFNQVQKDFQVEPLSEADFTRDNIIKGPLDYKGLGLTEKPDLQDFKGAGFVSIFSRDQVAIITAVSKEVSSTGDPVLISRIIRGDKQPGVYAAIEAAVKTKQAHSIAVPNPEEIIEE